MYLKGYIVVFDLIGQRVNGLLGFVRVHTIDVGHAAEPHGESEMAHVEELLFGEHAAVSTWPHFSHYYVHTRKK